MEWTDWKGVTYSLQDEWAYATSPAKRTPQCTAGTRDDANDGKPLDAFVQVLASPPSC